MSIEFRCRQCLHLQKSDESKIGQQFYCPVCYCKLTVPAESTIKPRDESQLYGLAAKSGDIQAQPELISFRCDVCQSIIGVRKEQAGEEIVCEECGKKITVPKSIAKIAESRLKNKQDKAIALMSSKETYSLNNGNTVPAKDLPKQFRFSCKLCQTALFAAKEQVGTEVTCPDCTTKTTVPLPPKEIESSSLPPSVLGDVTAYNIATHSSVVPKENLVPVVCRLCRTRMYAEESQIGKFQTCPDCGTQTEIKAFQKPLITKTSTTSADAYVPDRTDKPAPRPFLAFRTSLSPAILRKRLNEWESCRSLERPPLPKRPLTERFFVPFAHADTWLYLVLFVASGPLGAIVHFLYTCLMGGYAIVGTLILTPLFVTLYAAVYCVFASFLLHFYTITQSGIDKEEFKGELVPFDYAAVGFWLFMFAFAAVVPGFFIGKTFEQVELLAVAMQVSFWFFFPIFFLSSLEAGSMFAVLAKNTLASLYRQPFAWFRFYCLTGILFVVSDGCLYVAVALYFTGSLVIEWIALTLLFFVLAIQSLFFFRLLGRLAWLIEETYRQKSELEAESI